MSQNYNIGSPTPGHSLLAEIEQILNGLSSLSGAAGDVKFSIQKSEGKDGWCEIEVSGQISNGQDIDGKEIWKSPELNDRYSGQTLKAVVEQILADVKSHYGASL
jgi:hypothetical protein